MICANGEQKTPIGETGIFFICNLSGNVCQFVKWCYQTNLYEASTDPSGKTCENFCLNKKE
jgi:hypothetical protein